MVTTPPDQPVEDLGKLSVLAGVREFPGARQVREPGLAHAEGGGRARHRRAGIDRMSILPTMTTGGFPEDSPANARQPVDRATSSPIRRRRTSIAPTVIEALKTVFDPEIPVNIFELGLIYDVFVDADGRGRRSR